MVTMPYLSPVPLVGADPLGRGRRVKARKTTACGSALTRRTRPGQSSAEGTSHPSHQPQPPTASNPGNSLASRPRAQDAQRPSTGSGAAALP
jgi:hypothetical protein